MAAFVTCEIDRGVALVTLARPERMNAFGRELGGQFDETMARLGVDRGVRVVVLTGAGRAFTAGGDLERLHELRESRGATLDGRRPGDPNPIFDGLTEAPPELRARYQLPMALPQPVIAAVNGVCAGVGLALAASCDLRFAAPEAYFTASFSRMGLSAEGGLAWRLPQLIGEAAAADLLFSGRKLDAAEACALGLVNAVTAPGGALDHALGYARNLADTVSPRSLRVIKRQLRAARSQTALQALSLAYDEVAASLASADFAEGLAAFVERRPARFPGDD